MQSSAFCRADGGAFSGLCVLNSAPIEAAIVAP
jgi:hypothetical protein